MKRVGGGPIYLVLDNIYTLYKQEQCNVVENVNVNFWVVNHKLSFMYYYLRTCII